MRTRAILPPVLVVAVAALVALSTVSAFAQQGWRPVGQVVQSDEYSDEYIMAEQPAAPAPGAQPPVAKPPAVKPVPKPEPAPEIDEAADVFGPSTRLAAADPTMRLASVPNMFGDSPFGVGGQVFPESGFYPHSTTYSDLPTAGSARRVKIAENNKALPTDRVFFNYNHFQNALDSFDFNAGSRSASIDQYTLGLEKTFLDGQWSCELRLPLTGAYRAETQGFSVSTSHYGNLALILKRLLYTTDTCAVGAGLGIDLPTGSDVQGHIADTPFAIDNDAVNLLPYIGFLAEPTDRVFFHGFLQVDVPLNGDRVVLGTTQLGKLNEQTLMYLDASMGYWLFRNPNSSCITGVAGVVEFHYTTTLQDADIVSGTDGVYFLGAGNVWNRLDIVNMTLGVHTQIGELSSLGVGAVLPLDDRPDRQFDAEVQILFNRKF